MAIEAAQLAHQGMVYAIEPEPADLALIQANAEAFGVPNVRPVAGRAPRGPRRPPRARRHLRRRHRPAGRPVLTAAYARLGPGGRLAVNVATIDGLATAHETLKKLAGEVAVWNVVDRPRDRADGPGPVRGGQPDLPPGRHQDHPAGRLNDTPPHLPGCCVFEPRSPFLAVRGTPGLVRTSARAGPAAAATRVAGGAGMGHLENPEAGEEVIGSSRLIEAWPDLSSVPATMPPAVAAAVSTMAAAVSTMAAAVSTMAAVFTMAAAVPAAVPAVMAAPVGGKVRTLAPVRGIKRARTRGREVSARGESLGLSRAGPESGKAAEPQDGREGNDRHLLVESHLDSSFSLSSREARGESHSTRFSSRWLLFPSPRIKYWHLARCDGD